MPYATNADAPPDIRQRFSGHCLTVWREVWNDNFGRNGDEGRAFAAAEIAGRNCKEATKAMATMPMPESEAAMRDHLEADHGADAADMSFAEMRRRHDAMHVGGDAGHMHEGMMAAGKSLAVKRIAPDTIEGLAIPYGRDVDGEQFTAATDLCLDWFGKSGRPVLYDHGFEGPGPSVIGRQVEYEEREDGRWAQAQLARSHRYRKAVDRLIDEGALGFSSGAMPHLVKMGKAGRIERWPWVELSLTPIPAHPGAMVHYVKSAAFLEHLEDADTQLSIAAVKAIAAGLDPEAAPGTESLDDKAGRVSAAVDELRDHARAAAEMRSKAGRVLSAANRERISKALASRDAVLAAYADLEELLAETDPEAAGKASAELERQLLAFEATEARLLGVAVPQMP